MPHSSSSPVTTRTSSPARIAGSAATTCRAKAFFPSRIKSATSGRILTLYAGGARTSLSRRAPAIPRVSRPSEARTVASLCPASSTWRMRPVREYTNSDPSGKSPVPAPRPNWKSAMTLTRASGLLGDELVDSLDKVLLRFSGDISPCGDPVAPPGTPHLHGCNGEGMLEVDAA